MLRKRMLYTTIISLILVSFSLASCAPTATAPVASEAPAPAATEAPAPAATEAPAPAATEAPAKIYKFAGIFAGTTKDDSWNSLGFLALEAAKTGANVETSYSERVEVPDMERVVSEYANSGYTIIWTHGGQYTSTIVKTLADSYPKVSFIVEGDGPNKDAMGKKNVWYVDRGHIPGLYSMGYLGTLWTKSGVIGYIGGFPLPYEWGQIHAMQQAIKDTGSNAKLEFIITGDFNDPVKGKQAAEALIAKKADFIFVDLDLGGSGVMQAVSEAKNPDLRVASNFTLFENTPEWVTYYTYDFRGTLTDIVQQIQKGTMGGAVKLEYGKGKARSIDFPLRNVPKEINEKIQQVADDVESGKIEVVEDYSKIE